MRARHGGYSPKAQTTLILCLDLAIPHRGKASPSRESQTNVLKAIEKFYLRRGCPANLLGNLL